ncbi:uncharacterized protein LOC109538972 isoform X2 [Dendroctonus ponderosae]|nr:uncharacterized protein LOC109538972 isoform X2 [Dendroctonus ponderosae]KAH1025420.1 hypothetical protein HUJ05_010152 [Dendroctonus ponderosae]
MGNTNSYSQRRNEVNQKIQEKNHICIAMNEEVQEAIESKDPTIVKKLMAEVAAHMIDLQQLRSMELSSSERGRSQRILKNFEMFMASLKSVLVPESPAFQSSSRPCNSSRIEPDIVSDLIHLENSDSTRRNSSLTTPESSANPSATHSQRQKDLPLHTSTCHAIEGVFQAIVSEFDFLKDKLQRPIDDIGEYYQIDKGVLFLQLQLNSVELPDNSPLYATKFKLLEQLESFRLLLDQKSGELEEQQQLAKEVNTLELKLDSAVTEQELQCLNKRAQLIQETIKNGIWDDNLVENKADILKRLFAILVKINCASKTEDTELDELEGIRSIDRILEEEAEKLNINDDEELYANVPHRSRSEVDLQPRLRRTSSNVSQRGTVYINADVIRQNTTSDKPQIFSNSVQKYLEPINKRPLPLPRNYEEKVINDLPNQWRRLNKILNSQLISDAEKSEVAEIRKQAEIAKNLFERKIRKIMDKVEESVEL